MTTIVRFRVGDAPYAMPVERISEVRSARDLTPLPDPRDGVAGLMRRGDSTITVLTMSERAGRHVIVIDSGAAEFALLVDEVTGVHRVDDASVRPSPAGQRHGVVGGVVADGAELVFLLDVSALARRLTP
ncbi:MAG TPA: chemotaxis protein CheW [Acidimicrobiales bacterium]|nr:chemotaxis protein CheW [Acidimicrobiales bacterium]